jgi:glucokinase
MRAVGVDLGGTNVRAALVDAAEGLVVGPEVKAAVGEHHSPDEVAALVASVVRAADPERSAATVGVGVAAMLRGMSGVVINAPNFGWREVDLRGMLRAHLGERVEIYNDLKAIAFGEVHWGAARGVTHALFVFVGTGVGSGLVIDGKLDFGQSHLAGEIGHIKVVRDGRICGCGQRGCLEAYTSGRNIQLRAREELSAGAQSLAVELAGGIQAVNAGHVDQAAARGDAWARNLVDQVGDILGLALANLVTTLNPTRLVMGGGVWQGCPEIRKRTALAFDATVNIASREGFSIVESILGDAAGVLGAAALASSSA